MTNRHRIFFITLVLLTAIFAARLIYLQIYKYDFYKNKSKNQFKRVVHLYPNRGTILDRNLTPLALTQPTYHIYAVPDDIENKWTFAKLVTTTLKTDRKTLSDKLYKTKAPFLWIKRHCNEDTMQALKALNLQWIF